MRLPCWLEINSAYSKRSVKESHPPSTQNSLPNSSGNGLRAELDPYDPETTVK